MATIPNDQIRWVGTLYGGSPAPVTMPEAASQTFVAGELVYGAAGYLTEIAGDTPALILGVAAQDAHNSTPAGTDEASVYRALEGMVFEGTLKTGGSDYVLLATDRMRVAGITRNTSDGKVYLDAAVTGGANARVAIIKPHDTAEKGLIGDTNARVLFEFLPGFVQGRTTS